MIPLPVYDNDHYVIKNPIWLPLITSCFNKEISTQFDTNTPTGRAVQTIYINGGEIVND